MGSWKERTELLLGKPAVDFLSQKHILVVGVGGVGAYAAEMVVRAGIGEITIVDADNVNESNLNRQLIALQSTIGLAKTDVLKNRLLDINPNLKIHVLNEFLKDDRTFEILDSVRYDYIIDAIDTLSPKVFLIYAALERKIPIISSMGAGAKKDITLIKLTDIAKSYNCALAKMVRKRLSKLGIKRGFKCVFSAELADEKAVKLIDDEQNKVSTVGTISYMPATFGNYIAWHVIGELTKNEQDSIHEGVSHE